MPLNFQKGGAAAEKPKIADKPQSKAKADKPKASSGGVSFLHYGKDDQQTGRDGAIESLIHRPMSIGLLATNMQLAIPVRQDISLPNPAVAFDLRASHDPFCEERVSRLHCPEGQRRRRHHQLLD